MEPQKPTAQPYHVFINHRGTDVKKGIVSLIYNRLKEIQGNLRVFVDEKEIPHGVNFSDAIKKAIESASVHIAVFSPGYAESKWCLEELVLMLRSKGTVIPVFCDVEPWVLRFIDKGCFQEGFKKLQGRHPPEEITKWKEALLEASELQGVKFETTKSDFWDFVVQIVDIVLKEFNRRSTVGLQQPTEDLRIGGSSSQEVRTESGLLPKLSVPKKFIRKEFALAHEPDVSELSEADEDEPCVSNLLEAEENGPAVSELFGADGPAVSELHRADEAGPAISELSEAHENMLALN